MINNELLVNCDKSYDKRDYISARSLNQVCYTKVTRCATVCCVNIKLGFKFHYSENFALCVFGITEFQFVVCSVINHGSLIKYSIARGKYLFSSNILVHKRDSINL